MFTRLKRWSKQIATVHLLKTNQTGEIVFFFVVVDFLVAIAVIVVAVAAAATATS